MNTRLPSPKFRRRTMFSYNNYESMDEVVYQAWIGTQVALHCTPGNLCSSARPEVWVTSGHHILTKTHDRNSYRGGSDRERREVGVGDRRTRVPTCSTRNLPAP